MLFSKSFPFFILVAMWVILSALIDPERNLVQGVAVIVVVTVIWGVMKKLWGYRAKVIDTVGARLDAKLLAGVN